MSHLNLHPLFRRSIGFDRLNDFIDYAMQSDAPNYPPYNIEKHGDNDYRIVVATAGFLEHELEINLENRVLTIQGKPETQNRMMWLISIKALPVVRLKSRSASMSILKCSMQTTPTAD